MPSFVITGGPGSGKSTLLDALAEHGYPTVAEVSRELIRKQVLAGTDCVPWLDLPRFAKLCMQQMKIDFEQYSSLENTFFDRGMPDILAYLRVGGYVADNDLEEAVSTFRYAKKVFIAPPWEGIYVNDQERWQTFAEACVLFESIQNVYQQLGYQLIVLPKVSVAERAAFIIRKISE